MKKCHKLRTHSLCMKVNVSAQTLSVGGIIVSGMAMFTVLKGVLSVCKTWSFVVQKITSCALKGYLLQTHRKQMETVNVTVPFGIIFQ